MERDGEIVDQHGSKRRFKKDKYSTSNFLYKKKEDENKADEIANLNAEIIKLKDSLNTTINTSLSSMSSSFNNLSTGVTKDMTAALTKVDEKVAAFNSQVENLNESQKGINRPQTNNLLMSQQVMGSSHLGQTAGNQGFDNSQILN